MPENNVFLKFKMSTFCKKNNLAIIIYIRNQLQFNMSLFKVKEIQTCAEKYLKQFEGSSELLKLATQLLKDLKIMYMQLHEEWSRDLQVSP